MQSGMLVLSAMDTSAHFGATLVLEQAEWLMTLLLQHPDQDVEP